MKVVFCAYDGKSQGGPTVWMPRLLPDLLSEGIGVEVLILHWDAAADCVMMPKLRQSGVRFRHLRINRKIPLQKRIRWLLAQAREIQPDVFVAHHVVPAFLAARYIRRAGIPTVGVIHSDEDFYEALVDHYCIDPTFRSIDTLVTVSKHLESGLRSRRLDNVRIERIPCGCPVPERGRMHSGDGPLRVLYLGRLAQKQKRILDLVDAFLAASRQLENVRFTIVGDGPERGEVARRLEVANNHSVQLLDPVQPEEVFSLMLQNDVFVLLSDYEGLPIALIEAMGCGLVPVCLRTRSGIEELIVNGSNGILVDDRKDAFISTLRTLRDHPMARSEIGDAARDTILAEYASELNHERWKALIEDLTDATQARRVGQPVHIALPPVDARFRYEDSHRETRLRRCQLGFRRHRGRLRQKFEAIRRRLAAYSASF